MCTDEITYDIFEHHKNRKFRQKSEIFSQYTNNICLNMGKIVYLVP